MIQIVKSTLLKITNLLKPISSEPQTEARTILAHILKIPPPELINHHDRLLTSNVKRKTTNVISHRLTGKPLQYILKEAWFYNYPFYVDERVLIPRSETEFLVTKVLEWITNIYLNPQTPPHPLFHKEGGNSALLRSPLSSAEVDVSHLVIADIGTGCGNIAITLALELNNLNEHKPISSASSFVELRRRALEKRARNPLQNRGQAGEFSRNSPPTGGSLARIDIYATDISSEALAVAKLNAQKLLMTNYQLPMTQITFLPGSLLAPLPEPANIIVTNLPYIPTDRISHLQTEVKDHEPHLALDGGEDGLQLYRQLFQQMANLADGFKPPQGSKPTNLAKVPKPSQGSLPRWRSPGLFLAEIDYTHRHIAADIFKQYFPQAQVEVIVDPIHKQPFLQAKL